jgi:hypothetical protein
MASPNQRKSFLFAQSSGFSLGYQHRPERSRRKEMIEQTACFSVFMNLQEASMFGMMATVQNMVQEPGPMVYVCFITM